MKQMRFLGFYCLGLLALAMIGSPRSAGANEISLPATSTAFLGRTIDLDLTLTATDVLQGVQAIADWDAAVLQGVNIAPATGAGEALDGADTVVSQIDNGYFILAAVLDTDPFDAGSPEEIPVGTHRIATVSFQGVAEETSTDIVFRDDVYSTTEFGPELSNIVVVDSQSVGVGEGLVLSGGTVNVLGIPPGTLSVADAFSPGPEQQASKPAEVPVTTQVLLDSSSEAVQAYVVAAQHDPSVVSLVGASIDGTDAAANGAEFVFVDTFPNGALIAVVMDYDPPFADQSVSGTAGAEASVATLSYVLEVDRNLSNCDVDPSEPGADITTSIQLVDGVFGSPVQENVIVIAGQSKNPELVSGTLTFGPCVCPPKGFLGKAFAAGGELVRVERDAAGQFVFAEGSYNYLPDPFGNLVPDVAGAPAPLESGVGEVFPVCFYYLSPLSVPDGGVDQGPGGNFFDDDVDLDDPQAVSMAFVYDEGLSCLGSYSIDGTVTQAVGGPGGAEFVNVSCDDGSRSGVIAIQVELTPTNDGETLPPTSDWLKLIAVDFTVTDAAPCGEAVNVRFQDGVTGGQNVPINNVFAIRNRSVPPEVTTGAVVSVGSEPTFLRGDANFDGFIDIADSVAIISSLFLTGVHRYDLPCEDAADVNDDSRIDLADSISELNYLFKSGRPPLAPFPDAGTDPTVDELDCVGGRVCP